MRRGSSLTNEVVLFDSWAWWEVVWGTSIGDRLVHRYLEAMGVRVLTVDYTLAEIAAKLAASGLAGRIPASLGVIEHASSLVPVTAEVAEVAASLRLDLRRADRSAGLFDAVVLAAARANRAVLISGDPCFAGQTDVRDS